MDYGNHRASFSLVLLAILLLSVCVAAVQADTMLRVTPTALGDDLGGGAPQRDANRAPVPTWSLLPAAPASMIPAYPPPWFTPTLRERLLLPLVFKGHPLRPTPTLTPTCVPTDPPPTQVPTLTPTTTLIPTPTPTMPMDSPEYGMHAFLWYHPEVASRDLQIIRDAGFGWVKQNFGWRDIEPSKGLFDWTNTDWIVDTCAEVGLDLIVRIDHQPQWAGGNYPINGPPDDYNDLGDFVYAVASRYRGRIRAYEVWNEPNLAKEWGGRRPRPIEYAPLLRIAYRRIKEADPDALVMSAGLSPTGTDNQTARPDDVYLDKLYHHMGGSSEGYFDVLGVHAAGFKVPPETDPGEVAARPDLGGSRFCCFRHVEDLRAIMVKYGDADKQIAALEFGWTSDPRRDSPYHWFAVTEEQKADYFVRAYQYAKVHWSPWMGLMSLIYVSKHEWTGNDEQYWWAITNPGWPEFSPRPAYLSVKAMPK